MTDDSTATDRTPGDSPADDTTRADSAPDKHLDRNVTFTQASNTEWHVVDSDDGTIVGRVENTGDSWTAYDQNDTPAGEHATAEAGMFSIVSTPAVGERMSGQDVLDDLQHDDGDHEQSQHEERRPGERMHDHHEETR
ncbi:hypothetical protein [Herbiconiux solani]|uniref:hypothetical protein n=1 Tax=Herbiconiux solani TaxID=661329 RepID=UPI0008244574|nr:hypothetical protein [Herbiconiux solani]